MVWNQRKKVEKTCEWSLVGLGQRGTGGGSAGWRRIGVPNPSSFLDAVSGELQATAHLIEVVQETCKMSGGRPFGEHLPSRGFRSGVGYRPTAVGLMQVSLNRRSGIKAVPSIDFTNAFYIKLGRGGEWENDSIQTGKLRLGWRRQSVDDINAGRWDLIDEQLRAKDQGKRVAATTSDLNALKIIAASSGEDIWITFHKAKMWWTRLTSGPVEQDSISKFRRAAEPWCDHAADGRLLVINALPGKISQLQGFRATVCRVRYGDLLRRTLNGTRSALATAIRDHREILAQDLTEAIKELHWQDFETLVDLVFRAAGWVRVSVLGQHAKAYDLELREPVIGDRYVVQVKSRAGLADLQATISSFSSEDFRRVFFIVHSPDDDLVGATDIPNHVEIVSPQRLGELAMDAGLVGWLEDKVS